MPTGYTAELYDGKDVSFPEFVMNCARAFGALIELRDSPDAPIPDEFAPSDYYVKMRAEAEVKLAKVEAMTYVELDAAADADYEKALAAHGGSVREKNERRLRYQRMLEQVQAWEPPTSEHQGLQDFMVQQLQESIRFDCQIHDGPTRLTAREWHDREVESAKWSLDYAEREAEAERTRAAERTAWVRSLRGSLEAEPVSAVELR